MSEWKEYKLGEIIVTNAKSITKDYPYKKIKYLDTGSITCNKIESLQELNLTDAPSRAKRLVNDEDIIYSTVRPDQLHYGYINSAPQNLVVSTGFVTITCNKEIVNPKFLYYSLTQNQTTEFLHSIAEASTSTYPSLKPSDIEALDIILPPLPEQEHIASILSSLDDKIDLLNRQNQTLESMAEALFRHYFIDNAQPEWEEKTLGDFILVKHGFAFNGEYISSETTNQILITPGNFKIGGGFKSDKLKYYSDNNYSEEYLLNTDDLIVTMTDLSVNGDTLGYGALVPVISLNEKYLHNQRIGKVVFKQQIGKYFIYYLMKTEDYQWFILSGASGTSIRHTSPSSICSYSFKLPEQIKINEFERLASSIQEKIKYNQTQINTLSNLRNTLLPKLMNREVEITEEMK